MISVGSKVQIFPGPLEIKRGNSSAGRASALQAEGRGFESRFLHCCSTVFENRIDERRRVRPKPRKRWRSNERNQEASWWRCTDQLVVGEEALEPNPGLHPVGRKQAATGLMVKLLRAHGGCLGVERRRRAWLAAKSFGEPQAGVDPKIPEWGNPSRVIPGNLWAEYIGSRRRTRGTETSQYPEEKKSKEIPRVVASERGHSPNQGTSVLWGRGASPG